MSQKFLQSIQKQLSSEGMDCTIVGDNETDPAESLLVYFGVDQKHRERVLQISATEQILATNFKKFSEIKTASGFYRLQFQTLFPIAFDPNQAANVASAINFLNGLLELPGLISDEANNKICYRVVQLVSKEDYDYALLTGIIGMSRIVLDMFSGLLEKIATGEMTYFELLDEIVKYTGVKPQETQP